MKEKDARVDYEPHQLILYVEKEDGSYGPIKTGSYITKNYVDDFWLKRKHLEEKCLEMLKNGEISPVGYFMILEELTDAEMAMRVNLSKGKVKKHKQPEYFEKISINLLRRYAEVFNVSLANMFLVIVITKENIRIKQVKTENPAVVITKIEEKKSE
jgi:hypothetical protein